MQFFRKYLLPGFIFQSITIGGGYGTGRELVQYFLLKGPLAGLGGMLVATLIWSLVLAVTFELARISRAFDYRSFIQGLLGKGWIAYEVVYVIGLILVLSVLGSAAGELVVEMIGAPGLVGIIFMMLVVGVLAFVGSSWIEKVLSAWSFALYLVYIFIVILFLSRYGDAISNALGMEGGEGNWFVGGLEYAAYNIGVLPAILFVARHFEKRQEAFLSGFIGGFIAMIPGLFIYLAMLSHYPSITSEAIPANFLMGQINMPWFQLVFQVVLFGTLIETGVGLIHGFNERISGMYKERGKQLSGLYRVIIAQVLLGLAIFIADAVGLIALIDKGYGWLTWGYWLVFLIPVLTIGVFRIWKHEEN